MNCKPGDMAVIVRTMGVSTVEPVLGWTFELTEIVHTGKFGPCWGYKGERRRHPDGWEIAFIADTILKPLRDPGDDAVDEMVLLLGKPKGETQPTRETEDVS
jgi:hypothetical protein